MKNKKTLTNKFDSINMIFKSKTNGNNEFGKNFPPNGELDILCHDFINTLGGITLRDGYECKVEGVKMDSWKGRIWRIVEEAGLLPK